MSDEHDASMSAYLDSAMSRDRGDDAISSETGEVAWAVWCAAREAGYPIPDASVGPDGRFAIYWDAGPHHISATIDPNPGDQNDCGWFYRRRASDETWGDDVVDGTIPETARHYFDRLMSQAAASPLTPLFAGAQ